ncbi:lantibiotic dehydratase, partial [Actinosynnema sp. NPDC059797]
RPISAAVVAPDGSAVEVDGERRWLYPGDLPGVLHRALSLPSVVPVGWADDDDHVPRLVVDEVVVSRARWNVELATAGVRGFEHWLAVQRLRRELGLPRHVFVRHPRETKPVHVDLDEPMAVEDVARLGPGRCAVTECLPAPDRLWWAPDGRQVCELRLPCLIDLSRGSR